MSDVLESGAYQRPLFIETDASDCLSGDFLTWQDYTADAAQGVLAATGEIGPHSVLAVRAERLIITINKMKHRNMLLGLGVAGRDPELNDEIVDRYVEGMPAVLKLSEAKSNRLYSEAYDTFCHATGFEALKGYGLGRNQVKHRIGKMWRDFRHDYLHPDEHKDVIKFRRTQEKYLPMDHPLREENRLAKHKKKSIQRKVAA